VARSAITGVQEDETESGPKREAVAKKK